MSMWTLPVLSMMLFFPHGGEIMSSRAMSPCRLAHVSSAASSVHVSTPSMSDTGMCVLPPPFAVLRQAAVRPPDLTPPLPLPRCHAPRQDRDFPRDIHAGEVIPRVRLRVARGLRLRHDAAEAGALHEAVEDVAEGAAEDALYLRRLSGESGSLGKRRGASSARHRRVSRVAAVRVAERSVCHRAALLSGGRACVTWKVIDPTKVCCASADKEQRSTNMSGKRCSTVQTGWRHTFRMRSPVSIRCLSVAITGRPAPTVACSANGRSHPHAC